MKKLMKKTKGPETDFLRNLFDRLESEGVSYAVMRNYETLPYSHGGSDLDLLVPPESKKTVVNSIHSVLKANKGTVVGISGAPGFLKVNVLGYKTGPGGGWWGLRIDINAGLYFKGLPLLDNTQVWPFERHNTIKVLPEGVAGVLGVLKEVLNNGEIPDRYLANARRAEERNWSTISRMLSPMGPKALGILRESIFSKPKNVDLTCKRARREFYRYRLMKQFFGYIQGRISSLASRLSRYFRPSGKVIAILGTDGAGKSTIIEAIKPALDEATHNATIVRHLRPDFLPPLSRFKGGNKEPSGPVVNPHGSRSSGFIGSFLRITYAALNYVLGYWFDTRLKVAKQPTVVIYDRYAYDLVLDQKRFRIALPTAVVRFFVRMAPRPDLIFCLYGSPEVLRARKNELPEEEVARQVEALKTFAASEPRAISINTEQTVEICRDQILQAISNHGRDGGLE